MGAARLRAGAAALALVSACVGTPPSTGSSSSAPGGTVVAPTSDAPPTSVAPVDPDVAAFLSDLPGRLLIRSGEAGLATTRPDGSDPRPLAGVADGVLGVLDAAWSPDGRRVAWSQVGQGEGLAVQQLVVADVRGGRRQVTEIDFAPFFLSWDPTAGRIGLLGNGTTSVQLAVAELGEGEATVRYLAEGRPFFFSWSPGGDALLANRNGGAAERLARDGSIRRIDRKIGLYQAPAWSADGATAYYARLRQGLAQELVARPTGGGAASVLAVGRGAFYFVASPDGSRIAFHAREPTELDFYDRSLPERATDLGVTLVDTRTGELTRVSDDPAIAWSWSPDGRRLAILEPVYTPEAILFRWRVTGGGAETLTEPFVAPLRYLQAIVPFFTQFAQSGTMWSPDGEAIAYAIDTPDGPRVVVRPVAGGTGAVVAPGDTVTWSPR